ncbi:uncharacterized protein LOC34622271 [Cyclospora cayetanensis]|uniref:Uncharacterized protein LOC34622271 n=1 Tax=Cyclospora cayetanensis TaxID=88456 RepID=A0A6P6S4W5_9EIME|nr:uncharacterized protein LOC34622271 [Cyclospora cayetanensis]
MGSKKDSIRLSTYDELFNTTPKPSASTLKKLRSVKHAGKGSELVAALRRQRVVVDERAIHFVAEARAGKRADARNSVFKLAQKYRVLPDSEHVQRIKQLYGKVKENEDSGDEEWDKASAKLPGKLELAAFLKLLHKDDAHEHLLDEMEEINQETADLPSDVVTQEEITDTSTITELDMIMHETEKKIDEEEEEEAGSEDSDVEFDEEDLKTLNSMQREFVGNNLFQWFKEIQKAYESGVKLVKVNRMGYKFIRIVTIKDMLLAIHQPYTQSQVKVDRQVALHSIVSVHLGKESKEFDAIEELVKSNQEAAEFNPKGTVCCVVRLPKNRSLSLVFL